MVDQEKADPFKEVREPLVAQGVRLDEAPIERTGEIGTVGRDLAQLRLEFEEIRAGSERQVSDQNCLDMAEFAANCTIGPEGLGPALLVIGDLPRPAITISAPTQQEKAPLYELALKEIEAEQGGR